MSVEAIQSLNAQLTCLIKEKKFDSPDLKKTIKKLKIMIFSTNNLPSQPKNFLTEARQFSESNLFYNLMTGSTKDIELAIENVRFFYENNFGIPKSSSHEQFKAIQLLSLLSSHRNQEFYTKLENLQTFELQNNMIQFVLKLNDAIEEGNYRKVFSLKKQSPLQFFKPFLDRVQDTIRIQLAKSAECAYNFLSIKEALQIFQVESEQKLKQFIETYTSQIDEPTVNWSFRDDKVYFERINLNNVRFNSEDLIKKTLIYAEQLEKIA